ncbi:MAG: hypothetical protein F6K00_30495 [Leptolyngbya sp. SIOISBB]|nr:hypothetical protein [Leptolyngbya sp. SIOISBB]
MKSLSTQLAYTVGAVAVSLFAVAAPTNAASVIYDFEVNNLDGSLAGETFSGFFEFDDSGLLGSGNEFLAVSDLSFSFFNGDIFTETDGTPEAAFLDGDFLGLSFSTDAEFSLIPGFFDLSEAFFSYDTPVEGVGTGDIVYTLRDPDVSVPEPVSALALLVVGALGASATLKHQRT